MEMWTSIIRAVLRRRKRVALLTAVVAMCVMLPPAYYLSKEPQRYRTGALVLLEARPDRVPIFQEFSPVRPLPVQMAILNSRSLAEAVVDILPPASLQELIDTSYQADYWQSIVDMYMRWQGIEPRKPDPKRRALAELQRARITFTAARDKSGIVTITAEASQPNVSVDIVTSYIEALMARTRSFNIEDARVSREFLERQLADVKRALQGREQALQTFTGERGGVRIPDQHRVAVERLAQTETALAEVESTRRMLETRLNALRESQKRPGDAKGDPKGARPVQPEIERLRTQLTQLEATLIELQTKYTEEHPRVQVVRNRIEEVRKILGDSLKDSVLPSAAAAVALVAPADRVNFADQLLTLESTYHASVAREEALRKRAEQLRQSMQGLSSGEAEYARLARELDRERALHALLTDKLTGARIREQGEMKVVKVIDPPSRPVPVGNERRALALTAAAAGALMIGAAVPVGLEWLNRKVENEQDVEAATGLPVLAVVPRVKVGPPLFGGQVSENGRHPTEQMMFTEAFRGLRVSIELSARGETLRSLLMTSAFPDEGKSTAVLNLGLALNEAGRRVVVADTDFLRPTLHRSMKIKSNKGLVEAMESGDSVDRALVPVNEGLWLAQRGESFLPRSRGMLAGSRLRELITEMTTKVDFVICDSSPVLLIPDNLLLASAVDGVVIVAKAGSTSLRDLSRTKAALEGAGARLLGVVLNEVPASHLKQYYRQYYTSYIKKLSRK